MFYNYKDKEIVQDVVTKCLCSIVDDIVDEYVHLRKYEFLSVYAPSGIVGIIVSELMDNIDDVFIHEESENSLLYNRKNKVLLTLSYDGMIFIEDVYSNNKTLKRSDGVLNYVYDSFSAKEVSRLSEDENPILVFGFEEDDLGVGNFAKEADYNCCGYCDEYNCECKNHYDCADCFEHEHDCDDTEETELSCEKSNDKNAYTYSVKCNLDADEALEIIKDMEHRMERINDMFADMENFRKLLHW